MFPGQGLLWRGKLRIIAHPKASNTFSVKNLTNLCSAQSLSSTKDALDNCCSIDLSYGSISGKTRSNLGAILRPKSSLHLATHSVCKFTQTEQQGDQPGFFKTLKQTCCVSGTRTKVPISVLVFHSTGTVSFSRFTLRVPGNAVSSAHGHSGVDSEHASGVQLAWILIKGLLSTV